MSRQSGPEVLAMTRIASGDHPPMELPPARTFMVFDIVEGPQAAFKYAYTWAGTAHLLTKVTLSQFIQFSFEVRKLQWHIRHSLHL